MRPSPRCSTRLADAVRGAVRLSDVVFLAGQVVSVERMRTSAGDPQTMVRLLPDGATETFCAYTVEDFDVVVGKIDASFASARGEA